MNTEITLVELTCEELEQVRGGISSYDPDAGYDPTSDGTDQSSLLNLGNNTALSVPGVFNLSNGTSLGLSLPALFQS